MGQNGAAHNGQIGVGAHKVVGELGYAGRVNHPARQNHRIVPITINSSPWFLQYSPYVYYNEHCICLNAEHTPMKIDRACFSKPWVVILLRSTRSSSNFPLRFRAMGVMVLWGSPSVSA